MSWGRPSLAVVGEIPSNPSREPLGRRAAFASRRVEGRARLSSSSSKMNRKSLVAILGALLASFALAGLVTAQEPPGFTAPETVDATTLELYNQYVARVGKIESDSVRAAIELVAARGHGNPEFREMLRRDFAASRREDNPGYDSRKLLALITAVLERDGGRRWQHEQVKRNGVAAARPLPSADILYQESPLLADVIKYGRKCGRSEIDDFSFAVRQAHHPQGKQFLADVLHNSPDAGNPFRDADRTKGKWPDNVGGSWDDARFHAAVGLAELGVEEGIRWLIEHARPNDFGIDGSVDRHAHASTRTGSLRANCNAVLSDLSGLPATSDGNPRDWDECWREHAASFVPRPVALRE